MSLHLHLDFYNQGHSFLLLFMPWQSLNLSYFSHLFFCQSLYYKVTKGCGQWRKKSILPLALPQMLHSLRESLLMFFDSPRFRESQQLCSCTAWSYGFLFVCFLSLRKVLSCLYWFDWYLVVSRNSLPVVKPLPVGCLVARVSNMALRAWLGRE